KGGSEIITALVRGESDLALPGIGNAIGQLQEGKIKLLAVRTPHRLRALPDVPTQEEVGLGGYPASPAWWGLLGPAGMPPEIVSKLNAAFKTVLTDPEFTKFLEDRFLEVVASTPDEFAAFMQSDRDGVKRLVSDLSIPMQ